MRWYQKPIALIGAAAVAYHECIRGRRTGVCVDCGRLEHASTDTCVCGGDVEENEHPEETLDDVERGDQEDWFGSWPYRVAGGALMLGAILGAFYLLEVAVESGSYRAGAVALLLVATVCSIQ